MALENEPEDEDSPQNQFCMAVEAADIERVQTFLAQGMSANTAYENEPVLQCAARLGYTEIAQILTEPISQAAMPVRSPANYVEVARLLLKHGADVNCRDDMGYTALILAAEVGNWEMVALLLDAGADMSICGGLNANFPLHSAAQAGHVEIVRLLLQRGANPNVLDTDGETVSYLQRLLFLEKEPERTSQILDLLQAAGALELIDARPISTTWP